MPNHDKDFAEAQAWARRMLADPNAVILDTETTGLDIWAEIVQIAIIDMAGDVLLNSLARPVGMIPPDATRIHGITMEHVRLAPTFAELCLLVRPLLAGRTVIIYNADYDLRLLHQSAKASMPEQVVLGNPAFDAASYECAMHWYSVWVGDWSDWHGSYRWQRLPGGDHSALGDCKATLRAIWHMATA